MTAVRPSAKQAIEVLKIHQLRRENGVIFQEVKGLREEVTNRQNHFEEARKDVSKLTDELKQMQQIVCDYGTRLASLDTGPTSCAEDIKRLQEIHQSLRGEFSEANTVSDATNLQKQDTIRALSEEMTLLKNQVIAWEKTCTESVNELRDDISNRVENGAVARLEDKLEDFVQEIDARFEALQMVNCVTDSFASPRNYQSGKCGRLRNAFSPSAPASPQILYEQDSNRDRWKPIDTQTALRATPPAMPETLVLARPREDTDVQTPSTLRSVPTREAISNIVHTQPMVKQIPTEPIQPVRSAVPLEVARQEIPTVKPLQKHVGTDWEALNGILKLRQLEDETLAQYLAKSQALATHFPGDPETVSVCLKRVVVGMCQDEERQFVREWLMTSEWTLENIRDCILLLTRCKDYSSMVDTESRSLEVHATATGLDECNNSHDFRQPGLPLSTSDHIVHTGLPPEDQLDKQQKLPRQIESQSQRVQHARAAKTQKMGKAKDGGGRQKRNISATHHPDNNKNQQDKVGGNMLDTESAPKTGVNSFVEPTVAHQNAATKKKTHRTRMERELRSLLNTTLIDKPTKELTKPQKRKALHQPDEDIQPASQPGQDPQSPLARRHVKPKRVPTLVARNAVKISTVPETSDAMRLPSIPVGPDDDPERESRETRSKGQMSGPPRRPVLSLTTSDFEGRDSGHHHRCNKSSFENSSMLGCVVTLPPFS